MRIDHAALSRHRTITMGFHVGHGLKAEKLYTSAIVMPAIQKRPWRQNVSISCPVGGTVLLSTDRVV
jgi:hypothetical protein